MDKFMRAVYELGIEVVQLNVLNPVTGRLEVRDFRTSDEEAL